MLLWVSVLLKQLNNLDLKFKENWPEKVRTFLGINIFSRNSYRRFFRYENLIQKRLITHWSIKVTR